MSRSKISPLMEDILADKRGAKLVHEAAMTGTIQLVPKSSGGQAVVFTLDQLPLIQRKLREYRRRKAAG